MGLFLESDSFELCFSSLGTSAKVLFKSVVSFKSCRESLWYYVSREDFPFSVNLLSTEEKGAGGSVFLEGLLAGQLLFLLIHPCSLASLKVCSKIGGLSFHAELESPST